MIASSQTSGAAAEMASAKKINKYADISAAYIVQPIAVESLGPVNDSATTFLTTLGHRISDVTGEPRELLFLWQRISICVQSYNTILLHQSFVLADEPDPKSYTIFILS